MEKRQAQDPEWLFDNFSSVFSMAPWKPGPPVPGIQLASCWLFQARLGKEKRGWLPGCCPNLVHLRRTQRTQGRSSGLKIGASVGSKDRALGFEAEDLEPSSWQHRGQAPGAFWP